MLDIFKYEKQNKYPHMSVADTAIWERFINKFPDAYESCQYDFHIGDAPPFNTLMDDGEDKNQDKLYRLRIDVIGHNGSDRDVIELKPSAGPSSIGQVKSYARLYNRDEPVTGKIRTVIITDKEIPNMYYLCKEENVELVVI